MLDYTLRGIALGVAPTPCSGDSWSVRHRTWPSRSSPILVAGPVIPRPIHPYWSRDVPSE